MGFSLDVTRSALQSDSENNQVKVAYQIVLDYRRMLLGAPTINYKNMQPFRLGSSPPTPREFMSPVCHLYMYVEILKFWYLLIGCQAGWSIR